MLRPLATLHRNNGLLARLLPARAEWRTVSKFVTQPMVGKGLYMLNSELKARVYTAPSLVL